MKKVMMLIAIVGSTLALFSSARAFTGVDEDTAQQIFVPENFVQYDVRCESHNYQYRQCAVSNRIFDAWVIRQHSNARCILGRTWGYTGRMLWVDRGCRATFRVNVRGRWLEGSEIEDLATDEYIDLEVNE